MQDISLLWLGWEQRRQGEKDEEEEEGDNKDANGNDERVGAAATDKQNNSRLTEWVKAGQCAEYL